MEFCDTTKRPILFVHGYLGGGDNFEIQAQRFSSNGYCRAAIRAFDYDGFTFSVSDPATQALTIDSLDAAVDALRTASGASQIDLVGHSLGTRVSTMYLATPASAAKIAHYANAAGGPTAQPVPEVNLSSDGDKIAGPRNMAPGAENPYIGYHDHVAVLTSSDSFQEMYHFFNGVVQIHPNPLPEQHIEVSGFYRNFSDNTPHAGVTIGVFEVSADTGDRLHATADFELTTDAAGAFGPFVAKPGARYEFFVPDAGEDGRPQHTYRGPFVRSTHLMYLKGFPKAGTAAAALLAGKIKYSDGQSGLIVQHGNRAMIAGTGSLTIDGSQVLTPEIAPEAKSLIALFAFDDNADGQSQLMPIAALSSLPFLSGVDVTFPVSASPIELVFDGATVHLHRWKSDTEGTMLVFLDN